MELIEAIIGLVIAIAGLVGAVVVAVRLSSRQSDKAFAILEREFNDEKAETKRLASRVLELEEKRAERTQKIAALEREVKVMIGQIEDLQAWKAQAQADIENKDKRIETLESANKQLLVENNVLQGRTDAYERAFKLMNRDPVKTETGEHEVSAPEAQTEPTGDESPAPEETKQDETKETES